VTHAVKTGFARAASAPAVLAGALVVTLVFSLSPTVWAQYVVLDQFLAALLLSPFGGVFQSAQVSGWTWLLVWSFLAGGILDRYARNRPTRGRGFFGACGAHLPAMLRLGAGEWLIWLAAAAVHRGTSRNYVLIIAGLAAGLVFLYARVRLVVEDRRSAIGALLAGARFIRRNPAAIVIFLLFAAAVWSATIVWGQVVPELSPGRLLPFAMAELLLTLLLFIVFASWASATSLFQSRLAHASYTAGPPLEWPESPAAEAITNLSASPIP
jgi:hypothetical protein